ncbi:MAG TPA: hypothetical protein VHP54_04590 [Caproiciproducens sp.]|nr:hypothetical protein [Caproiciproducens sp.]
MKKIISLICVFALIVTASVVAFAADTDYTAEVKSALENSSFVVGDYTYSLDKTTLTQAEAYLSKQTLTADQAFKIENAITTVQSYARDAISAGKTDMNLTGLLSSSQKAILNLFVDAAPNGQIFSTDGTNIIVVEKDGKTTTKIKIPSLVKSGNSSSSSSSSSSSTSSTPAPSAQVTTTTNATGGTAGTVAPVTETPAVSGTSASLSATVPTEAAAAVVSATAQNPVTVAIAAPAEQVTSQLSNAGVKTVAVTMSVPSQIANNTNANVDVSINMGKSVLENLKQTQKDLTLTVKDSSSNLPLYSWTFKGADMAKSTETIKDLDLALNVKSVTADAGVNKAVSAAGKGLLVTFGNNGQLPAPATVKMFVVDQGFTAGETVYLYYYNSDTKQIELLDNSAYKVDNSGYVSVVIDHCSEYVLLPKQVPAVASVRVDTGKTLKVKAGAAYQFMVTASSKPSFTAANNSVFKVTANGSKGNHYYFKATAVGKAGQSTGFYVNGEKAPRTVGTIVK